MAIAAALAAAALVVWPSAGIAPVRPVRRRGARELRSRSGIGGGVRGGCLLLGAVPVALLVGSIAGPAVATAAVIVAGTAVRSVAGLRRERRRSRDVGDIVDGIRTFCRELRAGADPAHAAAQAATVSRGSAVPLLRSLAAGPGASGAPIGGVAPEPPFAGVATSAGATAIAARLRAACLVSERHGVALRPQVEAIAETLSRGQRASADRQAQLAGSRMSGWVLTALPALGLLLGAGMGADPIGVLAGGGIGGVLLVVGTALTCGGLLWSARIARA